jgi:hypothetical protein
VGPQHIRLTTIRSASSGGLWYFSGVEPSDSTARKLVLVSGNNSSTGLPLAYTKSVSVRTEHRGYQSLVCIKGIVKSRRNRLSASEIISAATAAARKAFSHAGAPI